MVVDMDNGRTTGATTGGCLQKQEEKKKTSGGREVSFVVRRHYTLSRFES